MNKNARLMALGAALMVPMSIMDASQVSFHSARNRSYIPYYKEETDDDIRKRNRRKMAKASRKRNRKK